EVDDLPSALAADRRALEQIDTPHTVASECERLPERLSTDADGRDDAESGHADGHAALIAFPTPARRCCRRTRTSCSSRDRAAVDAIDSGRNPDRTADPDPGS